LATLRSEYPFLRVFRNERNLGIDGNILRAVDVNDCRHAWLLGEDDRLAPGAIARVLGVLEKEDAPFVYVNYASVNADFSGRSSPFRLPLQADCENIRRSVLGGKNAWSAGFIGACVVRKADWEKVDRARYVGTWFAHFGTILELCAGAKSP
jgi:hypothetical protein